MPVLRKLVSFTIYATIVILELPLVNSFHEHVKTTGTHDTSSKNNIHKLKPDLLFEITLHGFILWASLGFLTPVGVLIIRMSNKEQCGRRLKFLFYVHAISQILALLLATAGAVMSIKNFNNSFNNHHQRLGVALYGIIWLQALIGIFRPQRGSKRRSQWFFTHWILGTAMCLLGVINIYTGLQVYHEKTLRSVMLWTISFTSEISLMAFFYLFQDKWIYIQKQGVSLDTEPKKPTDKEILPREKQESEAETC
ncbi:Cytochrom_B561 domain-containing protein [Cephalotus follicularis]|uniref:Cytochrom_B561 domain-containing protein n=1 Tax=Cephalotus follicularis TaxID=3775 RepID=A0A1Q3D6N4_CEPFO|nr:Cytochrom_B561 domain-containing protein [Cephalotus follicularis]